ncbi:MAG: two-component system sensor histidine kinase RegB [Myxococcota bacterium]|jgi:two-component system sensor histidine kinase RegB
MDESLVWYVRLRWLAALALTLLAVAVLAGITPKWPLPSLLVVLASGVASNTAWTSRVNRPTSPQVVAAVIGVDVLLLTLLLHVTGGASSPFVLLYLVPVIVASFLLPASMAWGAVAVTGLGYASLFLLHGEATGPLGLAHSGSRAGAGRCRVERQAHIEGLALAYGFAAPLLALLVTRVRAAREDAIARLQAANVLQSRSERLTSLATLAAGAAHELASPLSTIFLVSGELRRRTDDPADLGDLDLVREEIERCRDILAQLAADSGAGMGEAAEPLDVVALVEEAIESRHAPVEVLGDAPEALLPRRLLTQALRRLLGNARDASGDQPLVVRVSADDSLRIMVEDRGHGMSAEVLERATEPFFTTKDEGRGMGLGLFFVVSVAEQLDGRLDLESTEGAGTRATLVLPLRTAPLRA